jgi:exopolyphosphatase/guanosine-5'-triphosphate,3'-diphosphate pyrophosphatase
VDTTRRIAAIDVGTVTTRLLVADVAPDGITEVERSTDITHLGAGLSASGALSQDAMARVADVLGRYAERLEATGVEAVRAIATSASRDAANGAEFGALAEARGVRLEIVPGAREAELSFLGTTYELRGDGQLVVDCGGGSTELVLGGVGGERAEREARIVAARSFDVGSRRMTELYLASDPPRPSELAAARAWAAEELRPFFERTDERARRMIAVAGTATSLAAIDLGRATYDPALVHGHVLTGSALAELLEMLAALPLDRRREVVGLHPERAGVIVAGALILETVLALAGLDELTVSEHDILYGILLDTYHDLRV